MTPTRRSRLKWVALLILGVGGAGVLAITALQDNMLYFIAPSDVQSTALPPDRNFRLGGLVEAGSVERDAESLEINFLVTDGAHSVRVSYAGILPDLFREGQGVIAQGHLDEQGVFQAREVLARHDETYMPPEVAEALKRAGAPHEVLK
jgi:cytochrome c-type biogenesis protein CcmE